MRERQTRVFLWVSVLAWGIGVGAKLYDLRVVAGAWSAAPPESLTLLPYGPRFPVDPGKFFMPTSLATFVAAFGALFSGWNTRWGYRVWLCLSAVLILAVWVFTVVVFWPSNAALFAGASGSATGAGDKADDTVDTPVGDARLVANGDDGSRIHLSSSGDQYRVSGQQSRLRSRR